MDKNLHDIDDIFNKVFLHYEDEPSGEVWNKLNVRLDKEDADKFKKRFLGWKRVAILLFFLLSGIVLYDSRRILQSNEEIALRNKKNIPESGTSIDSQILVSADSFAKKHSVLNLTGKIGVNGIPDSHTVTELQSKVSPESFFTKNEKSISKTDPGLLLSSAIRQATSTKNQLELQTETVEKPGKDQMIIHKKSELFSAVRDEDTVAAGEENKKTIYRFHPESMVYNDSALSPEAIPKAIQEERNTFKVNSGTVLTQGSIKLPLAESNHLPTGHFKPYWAITGFASHEWSQYNLNNEAPDNYPGTQNQQEEISNRENQESSFSAGLIASRQLTKHFGYKTGLIISNTFISIDPQEMYATREPGGTIGYKYITSSGYAYINPKFGLPPVLGDSLQSANAQHKLQSLAIPFQLVYRLDYRKLSIMPSAGISINFISKATVQTVVKDAFNRENISIQSLYGMRKVYLGFMADINFQYNYTKRWSFNVLPMLRYALTPITQSNVVKTYPYSVGISAGVTYHLFK